MAGKAGSWRFRQMTLEASVQVTFGVGRRRLAARVGVMFDVWGMLWVVDQPVQAVGGRPAWAEGSWAECFSAAYMTILALA